MNDFSSTTSTSVTCLEEGQHHTYCRLCEAMCAMIATVRDDRVVKLAPNRAHRYSRGHACVKGTSFAEIANDPHRLMRPLRRTGRPGEFEPVSWDEALDDIAGRLKSIIATHGPKAFACYIGNPMAFSSLNFFYGMGFAANCGSDKVYSPSSQDASAQLRATELLFGSAFPTPLPDLPKADLLYVFGANPLVSSASMINSPCIKDQLDAIAARKGVVVFDPRRTETARAYEHVAVRPAGDAWLAAAMLKVILQDGLHDRDFIAARVAGFERLEAFIDRVDMVEAARRSGVDADAIRLLARRFATTERAAVYMRVGLCRNRFATLSLALVNLLAVVTGRFGRPGTIGFGTGLNRRVEGAAAVGLDFSMKGAAPRSRVGNLPAVGGHHPATAMAADIPEPGADRVRAFLSFGGNPVLSVPGEGQMIRAMEALEFHFSIDLYLTETNRYADYILPSTSFLERSDTVAPWVQSMMESTLMATRAVVPPPGDTRRESDIFFDLSQRMGFATPIPMLPLPETAIAQGIPLTHDSLADIAIRMSDFGDHYGARPGGVTTEILAEQYPNGYSLPSDELLESTMACLGYPDRRIHINEELEGEFNRLLESAQEEMSPFELIGRRNIRWLNSWMHNAPRLARSQRPTLLMHPVDADLIGAESGEHVIVRSVNGAVEVELEISSDMMRGVVSYPHGFGHNPAGWPVAGAMPGVNINAITPSRPEDMEQTSGAARLDGIPVSIERIAAAQKRETQIA